MGAVIGRGEIMDVAQESFISSTYWTERIGPAAAIATIWKLKRCRVPSHVSRIGKRIMRGWEKLAGEAGLRVEVAGMPGLATFKLDYGDESQAVHTLFTQEMLDRGFLASKNFYTSYSHTDEVVEKYLAAVEEVFRVLAWAVEEGKVREMLRGPVAHAGFKRLT
jgi:glutamate-1-semialdehyde aminotransferase